MVLRHGGFPIRKSAGQSLFAAHRSLSQLVTSFIGSWCQGIRPMLFFAWTTFSKLLVYPGSSIFFSLELLCVSYLQFTRLSFYLRLAKLFNFYPYGKTWFRIFFIDFLVSLYFCLSCMSHRFFLKNLYDFSYSVFNEHSLNFRQGRLAFTKLLRYLNLFKYLRRSVISPKELFSFFLGSSGLEPPTSRLSGARSNQLSYEPICLGTVCLRFPSPSSVVSQIS